jgi:uncharacterized membrane protein
VDSTSSPDVNPPSPASLWKQHRFWLAVMVVAFFTVSLYLGVCAYDDLATSNGTDAGIITQAVSSTATGHNLPFYEAYDCVVKSRCSFLTVHPGFVLYAAVPFYDLAPATTTLMALRAALVAGAAIPLYALTRRATGSPGKGLLAAGLFLVWAPSMIGDAFSTHLESLLPIELFTLVALWQVGRYRLALLAALLSFLTLEVYPLFTFLVGAFFLIPYVDRWLRRRWSGWRHRTGSDVGPNPRLARIGSGIREAWRVRELRYLLVLMVSSVVAYVLLALWLNVWGHQVFGIRAPVLPPGWAGWFSNNSSPGIHPLGVILTSHQTLSTAEYWLVLYALVGFLPLLSPRALVLSVPWIGWTFLTDSSRFATIGTQYSMIAMAPIFVGLAYGLVRVQLGRPEPTVAASSSVPPAAPAPPTTRRARWRRRLPSARYAWAGVLVVVIVGNGLLAPIDPVLPALGFNPPPPFETGYFNHPTVIDASYQWMQQLIATLPRNATIDVSEYILPLLANYPHAYYLSDRDQQNLSNLPFNLTGGPQYVLVSAAELVDLGMNFSRNVSNPAEYGLRAYVASTLLGPVLLYEKSYAGTAERFGPAAAPVPSSYGPSSGLRPGGKGVVAANSSSPSGIVIQSLNQTNRSGQVWTGAEEFLWPANYTVDVSVVLSGSNLTRHPTAHALRVEVDGFGALLANETYLASEFVPGAWTTLSINITVANPVPEVDVNGFLESDLFSLAVASVAFHPLAS